MGCASILLETYQVVRDFIYPNPEDVMQELYDDSQENVRLNKLLTYSIELPDSLEKLPEVIRIRHFQSSVYQYDLTYSSLILSNALLRSNHFNEFPIERVNDYVYNLGRFLCNTAATTEEGEGIYLSLKNVDPESALSLNILAIKEAETLQQKRKSLNDELKNTLNSTDEDARRKALVNFITSQETIKAFKAEREVLLSMLNMCNIRLLKIKSESLYEK